MSTSKMWKGLGLLSLVAVMGCERGESPEEGLGAARQAQQNGPDFVVTAVKGPASVRPGQPLTVQVTVCNQGDMGDGTDVAVLLSEDTTLQMPGGPGPQSSDSVLNGTYVPYLNPGQCTTVPVSGNAYPPPSSTGPDGVFYLGAIVDPMNSRPESVETNNSKLGDRLGVGHRSDFVVTAVKGPASVRPGQNLTAQVTVCNQGTESDSTDVVVLLSEDTTLQLPGGPPPQSNDSVLNTAYVPFLYAGQCTTLSVSGNVYPPPSSTGPEGVFYLGAIVDPANNRMEFLEDNNSKVGGRVGVGHRSDFVVTAVTGPASVRPGQPLTAQVTVCNQGTESDSTDVAVLLSEDTTLQMPGGPGPQPGDSLLNTVYVPFLYAGQCTTLSVSGNVYPPPSSTGPDGAFYLGAIVDPMNNRMEFIETNNSRVGGRVGVGHRSDFVVTAVTGPASVRQGQSLTAQVTVCNQGTEGDSTDVAVLLSADTTLQMPVGPGSQPGDHLLNGVYVPYLNAGQCTTLSVSGTAHPPPSSTGPEGAFYLGAIVDPMNNRMELIEDNNSKVGGRIGIGHRADFVVTSVTGPASARLGEPLTAEVTVCNQGTEGDATDLVVLLSADTTLPTPGSPLPPNEDSVLSSTYVPYLNAGQCTTLSVSGNAYPPPSNMGSPEGIYYLGALVDPMNNRMELIEDNNGKVGSRLGMGNNPDFVITSVTAAASSVKPGQNLTAQVTVCNQGTQSGFTELALFLSADTSIQPYHPSQPGPSEDSIVGSAYSPELIPGQCATLPVSGPAYPPYLGNPEGAFYLGAVADPMNNRMELIEDNNAKAGSRIGVGHRADFVVTSVTTGTHSVKPGQDLTAQVTVCNQGTEGDSADVLVLLSADTSFQVSGGYPSPSDDQRVGGPLYVPFLNAGQCMTLPVSGPAYPPATGTGSPEGAFYLGAVVDPMNNRVELLEDNNSKAGSRIGVGHNPDFVVTAVSGPASVKVGNPFTAQVSVCNRGQSPGTVDVEVYFSADTTLSTSSTPGQPPADFYLGRVYGLSLGVGACTSVPVTLPANAPPSASYYLAAVADPFNMSQEIIEDNNVKLSVSPVYVTP